MRVFVITLSLIGALAMIDHALVPVRLSLLAGNEVRTLELAGALSVFVLWAVAAGLVYWYPAVAVWTYAAAGVIGLYAGLATEYQVLVIWGVLANVMAMLTTFARREKRRADRLDDERTKRLIAIGQAMSRVEASVAVLLTTTGQQGLGELVRAVPANGTDSAVKHRASEEDRLRYQDRATRFDAPAPLHR